MDDSSFEIALAKMARVNPAETNNIEVAFLQQIIADVRRDCASVRASSIQRNEPHPPPIINSAPLSSSSSTGVDFLKWGRLDGAGGAFESAVNRKQASRREVVGTAGEDAATTNAAVANIQRAKRYRDIISAAAGTSSSSSSSQISKSQSSNHFAIVGEIRLKINFLDFGVAGDRPQRFGKSGCWIPHGLIGVTEMYDQPWRFEIRHMPCDSREAPFVVNWMITCLASGTTISVTETTAQAIKRQQTGRTICNKVLQKALETRAVELEQLLPELKQVDHIRHNMVEEMVLTLRPKRCTVGLLFFGLLHETVQRHMESQVRPLLGNGLHGQGLATFSSSSSSLASEDLS